jgi:hypothetical protein
VVIVEPGSGYKQPPAIAVDGGGGGCVGVELEAVLSTETFHEIKVFPGVGLVSLSASAVEGEEAQEAGRQAE